MENLPVVYICDGRINIFGINGATTYGAGGIGHGCVA
jgi:hypothetical protein